MGRTVVGYPARRCFQVSGLGHGVKGDPQAKAMARESFPPWSPRVNFARIRVGELLVLRRPLGHEMTPVGGRYQHPFPAPAKTVPSSADFSAL